MKALSVFLLLLSSLAFGADGEVCSSSKVLSGPQIQNLRNIHATTCKTEITYEEYRGCMKEPIWAGGLRTTVCDKGRYKGCCYSRWNGNPRSDWELIRCDSIDNRDAWTAFLDLFR